MWHLTTPSEMVTTKDGAGIKFTWMAKNTSQHKAIKDDTILRYYSAVHSEKSQFTTETPQKVP